MKINNNNKDYIIIKDFYYLYTIMKINNNKVPLKGDPPCHLMPSYLESID